VAKEGSSDMTVIQGKTNKTKTVATGSGPVSVAVDPVTHKVYVANSGSNDVSDWPRRGTRAHASTIFSAAVRLQDRWMSYRASFG
jgi:DNA-binding beta-propeller fold protein YncE